MKECRLTQWSDRMFYGPAYRLVFWPVDRARGRAWPIRLAAVTLGWAWMFPVFFLTMGLLVIPTILGGVWDLTQDDDA